MRRQFIFPFITLIISSCGTDPQIELLKRENKILNDSLMLYKNEELNLSYQAWFSSLNPNIKLGEEYTAAVGISVVDMSKPYIVLIYEDKQHTKVIDTLPFNTTWQLSEYKNRPTKPGKYTWYGSVIQNKFGKILEYPFEVNYNVK